LCPAAPLRLATVLIVAPWCKMALHSASDYTHAMNDS
jgi:hypothetical protein